MIFIIFEGDGGIKLKTKSRMIIANLHKIIDIDRSGRKNVTI